MTTDRLINVGFAFNPLNLLPMLIFTVVIATPARVIPAFSTARHPDEWRRTNPDDQGLPTLTIEPEEMLADLRGR